MYTIIKIWSYSYCHQDNQIVYYSYCNHQNKIVYCNQDNEIVYCIQDNTIVCCNQDNNSVYCNQYNNIVYCNQDNKITHPHPGTNLRAEFFKNPGGGAHATKFKAFGKILTRIFHRSISIARGLHLTQCKKKLRNSFEAACYHVIMRISR